MKLEIVQNLELLNIIEYGNPENCPYTIQKVNLADTLLIYGEVYSDWMNQLNRKSWINNKVLNQLAVIIHTEFPDNKINWKSQFFMVEKKEYLEFVYEVKNTNVVKKPNDEIMDRINIGIDENNEEINSMVTTIVSNKLKELGFFD